MLSPDRLGSSAASAWSFRLDPSDGALLTLGAPKCHIVPAVPLTPNITMRIRRWLVDNIPACLMLSFRGVRPPLAAEGPGAGRGGTTGQVRG